MNLDLNKFKDGHIHFTGCAGAGMAPMLQLMHEKGFSVSGSDLLDNDTTQKLKKKGIPVFKGHSADNLPHDTENILLVYSSAVSEDNPEMLCAESRGIPRLRRGEALASLAGTHKRTVAVSGSHGKTSVTAMIAHIFKENNVPASWIVGGKVNGWESPCCLGNGDIFLTEVDESDGTHALMDSYLGIVTNLEDDHCWSVGGEEKLYGNFKSFAGKCERLLYLKNDFIENLFAFHNDKSEINADLESLRVLDSKKWGGYQLLNAATAVQACGILGFDMDSAASSLNSFPGVDRRMTTHCKSDKFLLIEDYAHHPTEVKNALELLKRRYPEYEMTVVFQPHRYARLERYADAFAKELNTADRIYVSAVFAAWTEKGKITSADLVEKIGKKASAIEPPWNFAAEKIFSGLQKEKKSLLVILGAGDIDKVLPCMKELACG
jgi:UDP-N-acetylmuramate--alanine ligase